MFRAALRWGVRGLAQVARRAAPAAEPAAAPAAAPLTWRGRAAYTAAYAYVCVNVGALLTNQNESLVALETFVVISREVLAPSEDEKLEKCLDVLARGLPLSTTLRELVVRTDGVAPRLLELSRSAHTVKARHHAAKALDTTCALPAARRALIDIGLHEGMVALILDPAALRFVRKATASALAQLAAGAARAAEAGDAQARADLDRLAAAGAIRALQASLDDPACARQRTRGALLRMCGALHAGTAEHARVLAALSGAERELVEARRAELAARKADPLAPLVDSAHSLLVEGGALMYLHTAAGGLVWGALESARARLGARQIARHALVTSAVTCLLPITVVGGLVTAYHELEKATDTRPQKLAMYSAAALLLYPGWRAMQVVEAVAPHWLGGHIVGFMSFFAWLRYTESDLLRSDAQLLAADSTRDGAADSSGPDSG
ncbi:hypothetical protein KFE25_006367 [Diacronema lutheri]|uniref:Uncharacterized protein n=2 Tax=Diacronema lutheri TaxID=2081491 RepID=A0A8J6CCI0_DIALT|nr:hypothetical protein KFE25_006367 [Diacronema lutheri]